MYVLALSDNKQIFCCCRGLQTRPPIRQTNCSFPTRFVTEPVFRTFILHFARLALLCFAKVGCGSEMKMKVFRTFILHFARLALLCFAKVGCGSEMKMKVFRTFILHFARLALPLHTIITLKINISVSIWKRLISWTLRS